jgi:hypothetical protein
MGLLSWIVKATSRRAGSRGRAAIGRTDKTVVLVTVSKVSDGTEAMGRSESRPDIPSTLGNLVSFCENGTVALTVRATIIPVHAKKVAIV